MSDVTDKQFEKIISDALLKAASIPCDAVDYRENLKGWVDEIEMAIEASAVSEKIK